ncbi:hypothetical protein VMT65_00420 [Nocardia sp. CDC153]|uniref:hypothetical protein n=1 Tax=Nocardia sp. CDC153 TaxID=3112167 RepID=UPI002DBBF700|nr:hypothetical protein [Nocardia sp. CDC153]MEC3951485.1 hypothetical protein [Nocardia sp. CDC153]
MGKVGAGVWDLVFPPGPPDLIADMFSAAVVADAIRPYDADLAQSVETCRDWRREYHRVFRGMTALAISAPEISLGMAAAGLDSVRHMLRFAVGRTVATLDTIDVDAEADAAVLETGEVAGEAAAVKRLEVPWRGRLLAEDALRLRLAEWQTRGILEADFVAAVERVIEHPEWLALPGFRVTVTGAGAELGPLRPLLAWGADVLAVDRPGRARWDRLRAAARGGAGVLRFPVVDAEAGVDIARSFPALARWITAHSDARPVLGLYAELPGAAGVRLAAASDVLAETLLRRHPDAALALLGSPTDTYAVPASVVAAARDRLVRRGFRGSAQDLVHKLAPRSLYRLNYARPIFDTDGGAWGLFDNLPALAGPDYALAQRLPRWRAVLARAAGHPVSFTVAPPAWTRSLARESGWRTAAYRAASRFGIEVFDPGTARTLLAAKLVADLHADNEPRTSNPEALFATGAAHGGLWRQPFAPRSLLAPAALSGAMRELRHKFQ